MPSNLVSAWLLLTLSAYMVLMAGDNQDVRTCWAFSIFKYLRNEAIKNTVKIVVP